MNILDFNDSKTWMSKLIKIIDKYEINKLVNNFKESDSYLDINDVKDVIGDEIIEEIFKYIYEYYEYIVFYHASSTNNLSSYLENGLIPMNVKNMNQLARDIYNEKDFPELTEKVFLNVLEKQDTSRREGIICCSFDKNELLDKDNSHYLVYGSEYILLIAQQLGVLGNEYPKYLDEKFKPIIFKFKIPLNKLDIQIIRSISDNILVRYLEIVSYPKIKLLIFSINPFFKKRISSNQILSHEYHQNIKCTMQKVINGYY